MTIEKIYTPDEVVYVQGCGTSLKGYDFNLLTGKRIISTNKGFVFLPNFDCIVSLDGKLYKDYAKDSLDVIGAKKCFTERPFENPYNLNIQLLRCPKWEGFNFDEDTDIVCSGNNSGYAAIQIAYKLGARNIVLLGIDMYSFDGNHFFDDEKVYGTYPTYAPDHWDFTVKKFNDMPAREMFLHGVNVINCSMKSAVTIFPKYPLSLAHELTPDICKKVNELHFNA
jgi:hypothetical protein